MTPQILSARPHAAAAARAGARFAPRHVDVSDPFEISRLSRDLGITWLQLLRIIDRVGTELRAVRSAVLDQHGVTWH